MKKALIVILSFLLMAGNVTCIRAEEDEGVSTDETILETYDMDPDQLNVRKIGEIESEEEFELNEADLHSPNEMVRVSIVLDEPSTLDKGYSAQMVVDDQNARSYRDQLKASQASMTRTIEAEIGKTLDVKWNLTLAVNIISANVRYGDIMKIRMIPGVKEVEIENRYQVQEDSVNTSNTSTHMVGATDSWLKGYTGAGQKIAIIDTGIDTTHQSFDEDAFNYAISQLDEAPELMGQVTAEVASQLNSGSSNYVSTKIPYAYNYVDENTVVNHVNDTQGEHGSHVAGIAAANRYIKNGNTYEEAIDSVKAVGMAPDAQLLVMKVFGAGGGAYDSDYMAAIEDALVLGCDSVNLSLGSSEQGFTYAGSYQDVLNRLTSEDNEGTVVTISAGNSYALTAFLDDLYDLYIDDVDMHTGGSPGTFINSLGTAAAENIGLTGAPLEFGGKEIYYTDSGSVSLPSIANTYSFVYIDALGESTDYSTIDDAVSLNGKIVMVNRGGLNFSVKGNNAASLGPKALIIVNNEPGGGTFGMSLDDFTGSFPMSMISYEDGQYIIANSSASQAGGLTYYTGTITVTDVVVAEEYASREDAKITDFSSWGVPGSLIMKPEITAPGGNIYSVFGTNKTPKETIAGGSDQYELMSGTSMAAPHMAGLAAVVAQYVKENGIVIDGYSRRALIQSLLMSTATPMKNDGNYLSILQQGAGLVEVSKAVESPSVILMNDAGLTTSTGAAADGKVKVEFGDDPDKSGEYAYSFTLHNLTDEDLSYSLNTDVFTQDYYEDDGDVFMAQSTALLDADVAYVWRTENSLRHDVNLDGIVNDLDAKAILDRLTGKIPESDTSYDWEEGEMDDDGVLSSHDAYLLRNYVQEESSGYILPANGTAEVEVTIQLTDGQKAELDEIYTSGAYIEGFTYLENSVTDDEGGVHEYEHSIPLLGFYGKWTDPSMFDNTSYVDTLYGTSKLPYTGDSNTNYMTLTYNGILERFVGNRYIVEEEFPYDRLAINSNSQIGSIVYSLVRSAGTTGFAISSIEEENLSVLGSAVVANEVTGIWYDQQNAVWKNTGSKFYSVNRAVSSFDLEEGDKFRVGFYAIPEYNAMKYNGDMTGASAGMLDGTGFRSVIESGDLGDGAFVGYDFVVDDTEPVIGTAALNDGQISIEASDNENLAYIGVLSLDGSVVYAEVAPGTSEYTISFDADEAIENAHGYIAVFVGDYAGNEVAKAIRVNDDIYEEKTVYVYTDTLSAGENYLILDGNATGTGHALSHTGTTVATNTVSIKAGIPETENANYIESKDVASTSVWTVGSGYTFMNEGLYIRRNNRALQMSTTNSNNNWSWNGTNHTLSNTAQNTTYYLRYNNSTYSLSTSASSVYLYQETVIRTEVDPFGVSSVELNKESLELYKGNTADLVAKVLPLTANDRSVTWSSSNPAVATVDPNGHIVAVARGTTQITATSNSNPAKSAVCDVNVLNVDKTLNSIIWDEEGQVYFSSFNCSSLPSWSPLHDASKGLPLHSAFMYSSSELYAATLDTSTADTTIYSVNRNNYDLTEYGTNFVWATDMAVGASSSTYADYIGFVYTFGTYLIAGPVEPGDDGEGGMYSGLPYALLDCSEYTNGAYLAGIACQRRNNNGGVYYFLDENGVIWQSTLSYSNNQGFVFSAPTKIVETGIGTSFLYQSLYYDGTYLYWSHTVDNYAELIIINPANQVVYHAGDFGDDVWPAGALYVDGSVAPASNEGVVESIDPANVSVRLSRNELMSAEVMERFYAEAKKSVQSYAEEQVEESEVEEPADVIEEMTEDEFVDEEPIDDGFVEEEPIDENTNEEVVVEHEDSTDPTDEENDAIGGLNSIKAIYNPVLKKLNTRVIAPGKAIEGYEGTEDESGYVFVEIKEDNDTTNGLYEIHYDPTALTYVEEETTSDCYSIHVDEVNGLIRFAFAVKDTPYAANEIIDRIKFTKPSKDTEVVVNTLEKNDNTQATDETVIPFTAEKIILTGQQIYLAGMISVQFNLVVPESMTGLRANLHYNIEDTVNEKLWEDKLEDIVYELDKAKNEEYTAEYQKKYGNNKTFYDESTGRFVLMYPNICSGQMTEQVTLTILDAQGNKQSFEYKENSYTEKSVSVRDYALLPLADSQAPAALKDLMKTMLNYGAMAQVRFNYNVNNPALKEEDSFKSEMDQAMAAVAPDATNDVVKDINDDGTIYSGLQLNLEGETSILVNFNKEVTSATVDGVDTPVVQNGAKFTVKINNIASGYLSKMYTIVVKVDGTEYTYKVSALSYCNNVLRASGAPDDLKDVCRAIYLYSAAAKAYFRTN